jgi:hypothetical protein
MNNVTGQAISLALLAVTIFVVFYVATRAIDKAKQRA